MGSAYLSDRFNMKNNIRKHMISIMHNIISRSFIQQEKEGLQTEDLVMWLCNIGMHYQIIFK